MRQAYLKAPRTIEWVDRPSPAPGRGEMLIDIRAALTCGTDLKTYRRGHPKLQYGPFGHEASGDVAAIGEGVTRFKVGDAVTWAPTAPCGACDRCRRGAENLCAHLFDAVALGAYGDQVLLPAGVVDRNVYPKPAHLSYIEAAFLEPFASVVHGWSVIRRADARRPLPQNVAIVGAGTIGLLHLAYARRFDLAATVIARGAERRRLATAFGAAEVIDADDAAWVASAAGSFDVAIECAGTSPAWRAAFDLVRASGRVLFFSGLQGGSMIALDATRLHYDEITCLGTFHFTPADVAEAYQLLASNAVDVRPLIAGVESLADLESVFERLDKREGHKYALVPGNGKPAWT